MDVVFGVAKVYTNTSLLEIDTEKLEFFNELSSIFAPSKLATAAPLL